MDTGHRITLVRRFDASPASLFRAWTQSTLLGLWWGGKGATDIVTRVEARAGGYFYVAGRLASGAVFEDWGSYTSYIRDEVLEFAWRGDNPANGRVVIQLLLLKDVTELTLVHFDLPDAETRERQLARWTAALDALTPVVGPD